MVETDKEMKQATKLCDDAITFAREMNFEDAFRKAISSNQLLLGIVKKHNRTGDEASLNRINEVVDSCIVRDEDMHHISLCDIVGMNKPMQDIKDAIEFPTLFPKAFNHGIKPYSTFLLFGLPGLGKTRLSGALAKFAKTIRPSTFFSAATSDLISRWQSETEKALLALFNKAESQEFSIIFFDEIDEIMSTRKEKDSEVGARLKTVFLRKIDGINGPLKNVLLIGATNRPWAIDSACLSRFQKKYYIPLPNEEQRKLLFQKEIKSYPTSLTVADFRSLAQKTEGYSGRNIRTLCQAFVMCQLRQEKASDGNLMDEPVLSKMTVLDCIKSSQSSIRECDQMAMEEFLEREFTTLHSTNKISRGFFF